MDKIEERNPDTGAKATAGKGIIKYTEIAKKVRPMVKELYRSSHEAKKTGQPIAYCFLSHCYEEILVAMDIVPIWTENFAGVCAAKRDAERFLLKAEEEGFSNRMCTYATCGLGFEAMHTELGEMPPKVTDGGMEQPDVMLGAGMMICDPRYKWYQAAQKYNDAPAYAHSLLWPPSDVDLDEVRDYYIQHTVEELEGLVDFLERTLKQKLDYDRLSQVVDIAEKTLRIWGAAYDLRKAVPTPMPTGDAMNIMLPGFTMLGTEDTLRFYQELYDELKYRVDNRMGIVPEEKYRVLWAGGLPPWFALDILNYFESLGAVFPAEVTYAPPTVGDIPETVTNPLDRIAWRFFNHWTYWFKPAQKRDVLPETEQLIDLIDEYKIDGVFMHRAFSCRTTHVGQINVLRELKQHRPLPSLILQSDIVDARTYSEVETKMKIDTFMEMMEIHKKERR